MNYPLVSILMPAWQSERFIFDAIGSIQEQTYPNWELLICEDGSEDETLDEIHRAIGDGDPRISVIVGDHQGQAESQNRAADKAKGKYLARLDADDLDHASRIMSQVAMLEADERLTHITCDMRYVNEAGEFIRDVAVGPMDIPRYLNAETGVCNASAVWRHCFHKTLGLRWRAEHDVSCDTDYNLQCIAGGARWGFLPRSWYYQRRHPGQMTKRLGPQMTAKFHELLAKYANGDYGS